MSCVTVNVPWAPQPLACMRRSGITSRSKCANFSISQISCRSAGPRRPAVMMLVLSATGAPVAFVNHFSVAMFSSSVVLDRVRRHRACLFGRLETSSFQCHLVGVPLRELGLGKNVAIGLAIALVLVAAIVPALPQSLGDRCSASRQVH